MKIDYLERQEITLEFGSKDARVTGDVERTEVTLTLRNAVSLFHLLRDELRRQGHDL